MKTFETRAAAYAAARREMKKIHGPAYLPKIGVDFTVYWSNAPFGWVFEIINEAAHRAEA